MCVHWCSLRWVDVRKHFASHYGVHGGIGKQLAALGLEFEVLCDAAAMCSRYIPSQQG